MAKKVTHSDKDNRHPYSGLTVCFGTLHKKEEVLAPLLSALGVACKATPINTDQFGTFSLETPRKLSSLETLRAKASAVFAREPEARLALASEGSFAPATSLLQSGGDREELLLVDRKLGIEIHAEAFGLGAELSSETLGATDDISAHLLKFKFPSHALIASPAELTGPYFKGINTLESLEQARQECERLSPIGKTLIAADLRAQFNPTRREVIRLAAQALVTKILSLCPACSTPGFGLIGHQGFLSCEECGLPSRFPAQELWGCLQCDHSSLKNRSDGQRLLPAEKCANCNP
jgi:hypothetical protein